MNRRKLFHLASGEAGNLAMIMPIVAATAIAAMLLWNYNGWRSNTMRTSRSALEMRSIALNILNRTKTVLSSYGGVLTTPTFANTCGVALGINADLANFRNFSVSPPGNGTPVTPGTYTYQYIYGGLDTLSHTCLLLDTEVPPNTELRQATVTVTQVSGADDFINLSRKVDIDVQVIYDPGATNSGFHEQSQIINLNQVVTLRAASIADYGVFFYDTANVSTASITASVPVVFLSPVYDASIGPVVQQAALLTNASLNNVTFAKRLDMAARALGTAAAVDGSVMSQIFRGGVKNLVFATAATNVNNYETTILPTGDAGPTGAAWTQTSDAVGAGNQVVAVPQLNAPSNPEPNIANAIPGLAAPSWPGGSTQTSFGPGTYHDTGYAALDSSCYPGAHSALTYINTAPTSTFTLSLNNTGSDNVVCAFIAAETVTITLGGGANSGVYLLGTIITRNLVVNGGGTATLYIGNPYHDDLGINDQGLNLLQVPSQETIADIRNQFAQEAQVGTARNFFLPILRYRPPLTDNSVRFRPNGGLSISLNAAGALDVPGQVVSGSLGAPTAMQNVACGAENTANVLPAPFAEIGQLQTLAGASTQNKIDLWATPAADNIVFRVVDP